MNIFELKYGDIEEWDKFVFSHPNSQFYCLYSYQPLLKVPLGIRKIVNLLAKDGDEIVGIMPNYVVDKQLISQGGILLKDGYEDLKLGFLRFVNKYVKDNKLHVSIVYPTFYSTKNEQLNGYEDVFLKMVVLSLEPSLEDIWKGLNRKNRNAIRKAKKSCIKITKAQGRKDMEDYHSFDVSAGKRKHRRSYPLSYYYDIWDVLKEQYHVMDVYFAELDGKRIAGVIVFKFHNKSHYGSGYFLHEYGSYQPNNLLHWQIISDLKKEGFESYNLNTVGLDSPDPQVRGIAHFKMSWGGDLVDYAYYVRYRSWFTKKLDQTNVLVPMVLRIAKRKLLWKKRM